MSGDYNPIHLSDLGARPFGLPGAIAHGMWSYARVIAHLGQEVPPIGTSTVWFRDPIRLPSTVRLGRSSDGGTIGISPLRVSAPTS
ncbi:MAG: MaoC/PaaZ C-terminal domain-containing protein [Dermatophilaceae bacterium]